MTVRVEIMRNNFMQKELTRSANVAESPHRLTSPVLLHLAILAVCYTGLVSRFASLQPALLHALSLTLLVVPPVRYQRQAGVLDLLLGLLPSRFTSWTSH
jgi:hypothetical protein